MHEAGVIKTVKAVSYIGEAVQSQASARVPRSRPAPACHVAPPAPQRSTDSTVGDFLRRGQHSFLSDAARSPFFYLAQINLERLKHAARELRKVSKEKRTAFAAEQAASTETELAEAPGVSQRLSNEDDSSAVMDMLAPIYR